MHDHLIILLNAVADEGSVPYNSQRLPNPWAFFLERVRVRMYPQRQEVERWTVLGIACGENCTTRVVLWSRYDCIDHVVRAFSVCALHLEYHICMIAVNGVCELPRLVHTARDYFDFLWSSSPRSKLVRYSFLVFSTLAC